MRALPPEAAMLLGAEKEKPGFLAYLVRAQGWGFALTHPDDDALSDEDWDAVANMRVRILTRAFERHVARQSDAV